MLIIVKENYKNTVIVGLRQNAHRQNPSSPTRAGIQVTGEGIATDGGEFAGGPQQELLKSHALGCQRNGFNSELPVKSREGGLVCVGGSFTERCLTCGSSLLSC